MIFSLNNYLITTGLLFSLANNRARIYPHLHECHVIVRRVDRRVVSSALRPHSREDGDRRRHDVAGKVHIRVTVMSDGGSRQQMER